MPASDHDLKQFAGRIRPFFEAELRDSAEELAFGIARNIGIYAKLLRPDTTLAQVLGWLRAVQPSASALNHVKWNPEMPTYHDLVLAHARDRQAA